MKLAFHLIVVAEARYGQISFNLENRFQNNWMPYPDYRIDR